MPRMGRIFRGQFGDKSLPSPDRRAREYIIRSKRLKRVKEGRISRVIGASESEIQDIKEGLDFNILNGRHEKESKRELRRLGFLYG